MFRFYILSVVLALTLVSAAHAEVQLCKIFSDHMVLQRGKAMPVFGIAGAAEKVAVTFAGKTLSATADAQGNWQVMLPSMSANTKGQEMTIAGSNTLTFSDVLVGDVWLCSGQSNMEMGLGGCNRKEDVDSANFPGIRSFHTPNTAAGVPLKMLKGNPSQVKGGKKPVESVSWDDCQKFLDKLNAKAGGQGGKFVLPTDAQWEYACRAGSTTKYYFGDDASKLGEYAWFVANAEWKTHPVGEKKPNAWGLYDMHGNVWEWCQDWHRPYTADAVTDPSGPATGWSRVFRGGCMADQAEGLLSIIRESDAPGMKNMALGLRASSVPADK